MSGAATPANVVAMLGSPERSDSVLKGVGINVTDDFGAAVEDSDEMLRGDIQPQQASGLDQAVAGPRMAAQIAGSSRAIVSPPLLV